MVSTGMKCVKYLLFFFNLLFFLAGLILIVAGALVQTKFNEYFAFFGGQTNAAAILLIVVGVIIFVIGFFGCCGAYKENHCMVITFAVLLCLVLILEMAAAIAAFVMKNQLEKYTAQEMKSAMVNFDVKDHDGVTLAWNNVQKQFHCCGVDVYTNWETNAKLNETHSVPDTCCNGTIEENCGQGKLLNPSGIYTQGCLNGFVDWAKSNIAIIGGVAAGLAFVEIIGVIIACCLGKAIRREYEVV